MILTPTAKDIITYMESLHNEEQRLNLMRFFKTGKGEYGDKQAIIDSLAQSDSLWRQRISMVCTWMTSRQGDASWCLRYAEMHLHHPHDLMHKAVGWMLREMGKQNNMDTLREFLKQHAREMPRTALRYAIERMSEDERTFWMKY